MKPQPRSAASADFRLPTASITSGVSTLSGIAHKPVLKGTA